MLHRPVSALIALAIAVLLMPGLSRAEGSPFSRNDQVATPDPAAIPALAAPLDLGNVILPGDPAAVEELFRHLPDTVWGHPANALQSGPDRIRASWGDDDAPFGPPLQLGAISLKRSDFFPHTFTADDYVAASSEYGDGVPTAFGRDGTLVWISGETTVGVAGDQRGTPVASQPVYTMVWGSIDGAWLFTAAATTPEGRDALVVAFVAVASSPSGTAVEATPCADPDAPHCGIDHEWYRWAGWNRSFQGASRVTGRSRNRP